MKSVVMIAYNFPPEGNAGAFRPLRFVRHLTSKGWRPTVITHETEMYERYDLSLLGLVPKGIEVIGVRNRDLWQAFQNRRGRGIQERVLNSAAETAARIQAGHHHPVRSFIRELVHRVEAWCYHPDEAMSWIRPAVKAIMQVCVAIKSDVIWASGPPWSSFIVAGRASHRSGVPYVLDFRDSWTMNYTQLERKRPAWAKELDRRTLRKLLRGSRAVIFRSDTEAECFWRAYYGALEASKIHIIPNGYEGAVEEFAAADGDKCEILYTGTLSDYRYDTLLQAICFIKQSSPAVADQLHFHFVGEGTEALGKDAAALGLTGIVTTSGPVSQHKIVRLSRNVHAFLMLERPATMRGHELLAGAKLFGYLKAGRPIVGILPSCEARKVLEGVGVSTLADVDSISDIVGVLCGLHNAWSNGTLVELAPDRVACKTYSAERQTEALTRALEGRLPAKVFVPGSVDIPRSLQNDIGREGWLSWA
jgi:hypothetical protein